MPTLENDRLVFRFPEIEPEASFSIDFQRTLRIPDSESTYGLPPGLGAFPLRHVEDHVNQLPEDMAKRGGVLMPMWQAEAMWLSFTNDGPDWGLDFPVAIKIAAGKINAVTGQPWSKGLNRDPQDYVVSPQQRWLDGFAVEKGVIRQFVAMPLGDGYTAEEQLTGKADWGGLQIMVVPLKADVWRKRREAYERQKEQERLEHERMLEQLSLTGDDNHDLTMRSLSERMPSMAVASRAMPMGFGGGGRMRQTVYPDRFRKEDWDVAAAERVFVHLIHAKDWKAITGSAPPNEPPAAAAYTKAGLPWFDYYGHDQDGLEGGGTLSDLKSVGSLFADKVGVLLPDSHDVDTGPTIALGPGRQPRSVASLIGDWDE
jgi:hypothetical protein